MDLVVPPGPGVPRGLVVPAADLVERFSRSSGPGGPGRGGGASPGKEWVMGGRGVFVVALAAAAIGGALLPIEYHDGAVARGVRHGLAVG